MDHLTAIYISLSTTNLLTLAAYVEINVIQRNSIIYNGCVAPSAHLATKLDHPFQLELYNTLLKKQQRK